MHHNFSKSVLFCYLNEMGNRISSRFNAYIVIWTEVVLHKYIYLLCIMDWIRLPSWNRTNILVIKKAVLNSISYIRDGLT